MKMKKKKKMRYLGFESKVSNKTGKSYITAQMKEGNSLFEFYVPADKIALITSIGKSEEYSEVIATIGITSYKGDARVDLEAVRPVGE